eukprot:CAMPEP_0178615738 /NCGR_PEP_ID=MMETSP0698-20121128/2835_1 /TAXON_ID=265572 /ORGANISM="Extubocellulus spinifer, Strain CCMP396" /LENGTH=248 /DNA_ID=CAMNT_0020254515 /DNA_START=156 /DNA_END=902 /DNA_ORIENTATION=-
MMDDVCLDESEEQEHSLPPPERRKAYSETASKRKRLGYLIWTIAGLLVVIVILAFSLAYVSSTSKNGSSSSSASTNTRDPAFDDDTNNNGGMDFDYGGVGDGNAASLGSYGSDSSYSSADDGGSYNPASDVSSGDPTTENTFEPTFEATIDDTYQALLKPTNEPSIAEARLDLPTGEPTMGGSVDDTSADDDDLDSFSMSASYEQGSMMSNGPFSNREYSSYPAAEGVRRRHRRLYRYSKRVIRSVSA